MYTYEGDTTVDEVLISPRQVFVHIVEVTTLRGPEVLG